MKKAKKKEKAMKEGEGREEVMEGVREA